jgi:N-acetylglucosaminyl-diphospho-decaprenol L-rhamnosyltransferase
VKKSRIPQARGPVGFAAEPDPRFEIVLITHNRRAELQHTLERLSVLPERPRLTVVDNGSQDGTAALVRSSYPGVRLLTPGRNLGAVGRNLGAALVEAPYIAFCDDDTWWEPGALSQAADLLDQCPSLAVVTAHILVEPGARDDPMSLEMARSPLAGAADIPGHALLSFLAGASMIRRQAFEEVGGFSARLWLGGEEELLASDLAAAGWAMTYVPEVVVHHRPSPARDPHLRRRHGIRNTLWFTWLRRPWRSALSRTVFLIRTVPRDLISAAAFLDAVRGLPWVVAERRVVPDDVEAGYRRLQEGQRGSSARRYVS